MSKTFAGSFGVLAYRPLFYKHLGLTSQQAGFILLLECFFSSLLVPAIGVITDKVSRPRAVLTCVFLFGMVTVSAQYFLPYAGSDVNGNYLCEFFSSECLLCLVFCKVLYYSYFYFATTSNLSFKTIYLLHTPRETLIRNTIVLKVFFKI